MIGQDSWKKYTDDTMTYEEYYIAETKQDEDPRSLVGPKSVFEIQRKWQFNLLTSYGLEPHHSVLDFGCGVLRAGIPLIDYLEPGNYTGCDLSDKCLLDGHRRIHENKLGHKNPTIIQNRGLSFDRISRAESSADFMMAQSVWTHLPPDRLEDCIENMGNVLANDSTVFATIYRAFGDEPFDQRKGVDWAYPLHWLREKLEDEGYTLDVLDIHHPTYQTTLHIERGSGAR